ncbi:MFS transporter, partial [Alienimonas sp. DA493]|uniref:MFS transporter n=1 Tax=Alienimonas sp. DA493 TaxID=3373605 RepID=UPI00375400C5
DSTLPRESGTERRNLATLAAYTVALRVSWIFKTESVVMPALLDTLTAPLTTVGGAGWVQGFLPLLNRTGQSVPPLLYADSLRDRPLKKWSVWATTLGMALPFAVLAVLLWTLRDRFAGTAAVAGFLALYGLFFAATGLNQLGFSTLQAKLIPPSRRGRLIAAGGVLGSFAAVSVAYGFLAGWRAESPASFAAPFAATAAGMLVSSTLVLFVREAPDEAAGNRGGRGFSVRGQVREAATVLRSDRNFRRIAAVACLFVTAQLVFPHYIVLAREAHGAGNLPLILFVAAQNVGAGLFSVAVGWIADRRGNRLAVRACLAGLASLPPSALILVRLEDPRLLAVLFFLLGLTPVTFKAVTNWTLELTEPENHPRYVSTLKLCMAAPFLFAVPVGAFVDVAGHGPAFLGVAGLVATGCGLTWLAPEPRRFFTELSAERG